MINIFLICICVFLFCFMYVLKVRLNKGKWPQGALESRASLGVVGLQKRVKFLYAFTVFFVIADVVTCFVFWSDVDRRVAVKFFGLLFLLLPALLVAEAWSNNLALDELNKEKISSKRKWLFYVVVFLCILCPLASAVWFFVMNNAQ